MRITTETQPSLFEQLDVLDDYRPRPAPLFQPQRIVLTKGSISTPQRQGLVDRICSAYPAAEVVEQLSVPHNKR